jgi:alkylhydroperoxidase family enzyme
VQATGGTEEKARHLLHAGESQAYTDVERAVIAYALELARTATVSDATFAALARHFPSQADRVEIHMAAALPNITNRVNSPLATELEEGVSPAAF